ncbi:hypothetical protein ACJX0J_024301, partial [Zea mays]
LLPLFLAVTFIFSLFLRNFHLSESKTKKKAQMGDDTASAEENISLQTEHNIDASNKTHIFGHEVIIHFLYEV